MYDRHTHSFIAKIWLEESADEAGRAIWRGMITHVPGGERSYLRTLSDVTTFMAPYLVKMGVRLSFVRRVRQWWKQQRRQRIED
jgi:hypothetical protein